MIRTVRACALVLLLIGPLLAQQRPLDNGSESRFDSIDARLFTDVLPPRAEKSVEDPPALADLLPEAPWYTERRESVLSLDFRDYSLEANPQRLILLEPESLSIVPSDADGQALRIDGRPDRIAGASRTLDPDKLAGRLIELSARVRMPEPYRLPPDAQPWFRPTIQLRWDRPHPDPARRAEGESLHEWHTIFETPRGEAKPDTFLPDNQFHTYRCRLAVPDDLTGALLQLAVQRCTATLIVDNVSLTLVQTREQRLLTPAPPGRDGNLLGPAGSFELGLTRGAVTTERPLSPLPGGAAGRDFGEYRVVDDAAEGRRALAVVARTGRSTAVELPWLGLTAGRPYTFSLWLKADRDDVRVSFGVGNAEWKLLGSSVTVGPSWRRYAATFTPIRAHLQAYWPWVSIEAPAQDTEVRLDGLRLEPGDQPTAYVPSPAVEIAIDTGTPVGPGLRNTFDEGQPVPVTARLLQRGDGPRTVRLRCVMESHTGRLFRALPDTPAEVTLPPGEVVEVPLHAGPQTRGLYRYWVVASDAETEEAGRGEALVAVLPAPKAQRLGFHDGPGSDPRTAAVAAGALRIGASTVADDGVPTGDWREQWTGDSRYDWSLFDTFVDGWSGHGIGVLHTIGPRIDAWPGWVIDRYGAQFELPRHGDVRILPPSKLLAAYVRDLATRYAGKIGAYQVFSGVDRQLDPREYLDLLSTARETIAAADPQAKVVGPGAVLPSSAEPGGFLDGLADAGAMPLLDAVTVGLNADYPEQLDAARDHLRELGARCGRPIWDTRHGYAEAPLLSDRLNPRGELEKGLQPLSPQSYDAAAFYARHELLLAAAGVSRSCLTPSVAEVEYLHAPVGPMVESDGSPRSSLVALSVFSAEVGRAPALGEWRWDLSLPVSAPYPATRPAGVRAVAFGTALDRCLIAWWTYQRDATVTVTFPPALRARAFVVTGEPVQPSADGQVLLTQAPLYLADLPRATLAELGRVRIAGVAPVAVPAPERQG